MFDKIFKVLLIALLSFIAYTLHTQRMNTKYLYSVLNDAAKEFSIKELGKNTRDLLESLGASEDSQ